MRTTDPAPSSTGRQLTFRPDIAGLRAIAVGLVVALHSGVTFVSGGYVGVDVFFVISGFLITSLLIDEVRETGRVSLLGFYARRARRILPAACFVIAATVVVAYLQLGALVGRTTAVDGRWAAGFAANFRFIEQGTDYFASNQPPSPLQHYWSLAVEEQFYLLWPTLVFGLVLLGRRFTKSTSTLTVGIVAVVAGSLFWSVTQSARAPTTAYFSPITRAWELGAGALIAVFAAAIARIPAPLRALTTWVGIGLVAYAAVAFSATTVFPGSAALVPVIGAVLIIAGGIGRPRAGAAGVLSFGPLQWLGLISFSIYLWHWPVFVIAEERSAAPLSNVARVMCVLITLALSVVSYYAIERPLHTTGFLKAAHARTAWAKSRKALLAGATAILLAVAVSAFTNRRAVSDINRATHPTATSGSLADGVSATMTTAEQITHLEGVVHRLVQKGLALHRVPAGVDPPVLKLHLDPRYTSCLQTQEGVAVKTCTFGAVKSKQTIAVFGDSHAMHWMPALDLYAQKAGYRLVSVYKLACPIPSLDVYTGWGAYPQCTTWRSDALRYINSLKPAAVILGFGLENTEPGNKFELDAWLSGLRTSLRSLSGSGARLIEIGNNPYLSEDPGLCLSRPRANPADCTAAYAHREYVDAELGLVRSMGATFIDVEPWLCSGGRCPVIIDKRIVYRDYGHLTPQYVSHMQPLLAVQFKSAGLR